MSSSRVTVAHGRENIEFSFSHVNRKTLEIAGGNQDAIKLTRGYFEIEVKGRLSPEKVKCLLEGWYLDKAEGKFHESFDRCWLHFEKRSGTACHATAKPRLQIRHMRRRWGSLSPNGRLTLNIDLIRAPRECIDYVILHELSHLPYTDHGPEFYRLLEKMMPGWEKRKHRP